MEIWIVSIILVCTLILLVSGKIAIDITALGIVVALMVSGLLTPREAVAGFANPAVITVGAMFLLSKALIRTGSVEFIAQRVTRWAGQSLTSAMLIILTIVGLASAFINNTPVVVLFIPVVLSTCCHFGFSPAKFLIPVSYASILAGSCTLIGTSTNIIVSDLSVGYGLAELGMFELAKVGLPIALAGVLFLIVAAPKLLPEMANPSCELKRNIKKYLAEFTVTTESELIGKLPLESVANRYPGIEILEVIRDSHVFYPTRDRVRIEPRDLVLVKGPASELVEIVNREDVELPLADLNADITSGAAESVVVEVIIPPSSSLRGQRLKDSRLMRDPEFHVIAVQRSGLHYTEKQITDVRLAVGDIVLVRLPWEKLDRLRGNPDFIVVEDVHQEIIEKQKAKRAALIFAAVVAAASTGLADIMVCALSGAFLMLASGCLQIRDAYRSLQGDVLVLIAGTIALGAAMEKTGASALYAQSFLSLFDSLPPVFIVSAFILLTSLGTQVISNNATAVLVLPVAVTTALKMGIDPRPLMVAVCIGASACFATPIGYQTNLLVYGPGGYRFTDYLKLGIPLNLLVLVLGSLLIPLFWPL
ncbi:MAG: SLC13 family permease [Desulfobacterales bacterium]